MINRIPQEKLETLIKNFLKNKIPFKKISTHGRTLVITEKLGSYENKESSFPSKELHFIKSVKDYVIKNNTYGRVRNYFKKDGSNNKIKYFFYNKTIVPGNVFENCYEIDIKNCYWDTAYFHYNLFDKELYEKGLLVSKKSRLAAIGSLAKVKNIIEFDGKEERKLPPVKSEKTEFLWNTICHKIGKTMFRASKLAKNDFLFFWVDGVFIKDKNKVNEIQKFLKYNGYESTVSLCEWVKFDEKGLVVKSKAKGKWITTTKEEIVIRDGKKFIKNVKTKVWKDERPFPYSGAISDKEIVNLNSI